MLFHNLINSKNHLTECWAFSPILFILWLVWYQIVKISFVIASSIKLCIILIPELPQVFFSKTTLMISRMKSFVIFSGDSLLHLSLMKMTTIKNQNLFEESHYDFFPSFDVAKLLIECGAKINAMNNEANTPLHTASRRENFNQEVNFLDLIIGFLGLFLYQIQSSFRLLNFYSSMELILI